MKTSMSSIGTTNQSKPDQLEELLSTTVEGVEQFKTALVDETEDRRVIEIAEELWDVVAAVEAVLKTLDFEELPDVIELDELPNAIDIESVFDAIAAGEAGEAIDLLKLKDTIKLRELWEAVDLIELRRAQQALRKEIGDVTNKAGNDDDPGSVELGGLIESRGAHSQFDAEARRKKIQELIEAAIESFRTVLFETHDKLRELYEFNQETLGQSDRQLTSSNPTIVSTLPKGPLPYSASTRCSTVPSQVRYSRVRNPPRIYGRRFENTSRRSR